MGTTVLPVKRLLDLMAQGKRVLGLSVTPTSHEVVALGPPFQSPNTLSTGSMLTPEQLAQLMDQQGAGALVLGGSALLKADGTTHYGVRKLISAVMGVSYDKSGLLPVVKSPPTPNGTTPTVLLCRSRKDNPSDMIINYMKCVQSKHPTAACWSSSASQ